jgi:Nickel responsive protein SCO4226-like
MLQPTFAQGLEVPVTEGEADISRAVVEHNVKEGVTSAHPFVRADERTTFCIYDPPGPKAIRKSATPKELPVDEIAPVHVSDPPLQRLNKPPTQK